MNAAQVHLLLNHVPIIGFALCTLLLVVAILRRSAELQMTALSGLFLIALIGIPTFLSGGRAEEVVEHLAGVTERAIHEHESAAWWALALMELAGLVALVAVVRLREGARIGGLLTAALVTALVACATLARTGHLGGLIRHPEITRGAAADAAPSDGERQDEHRGRRGD
jgi:hypothetical protein